MSSQLPPDPAWAPTPETMVFAGASLELAVDDARATLGPQAQIRAARRVRQGLRGRIRFEVLAAPAPPAPAAPGESPLDQVLAGLASAADRSPAPPPPPARRAAGPEEVVDLTLAELLAAADESETAGGPRRGTAVTAPGGAGSMAAGAAPEDFTALVRAALQRVALEDEAPAGGGPHPDPDLLDAVAGALGALGSPPPGPAPRAAAALPAPRQPQPQPPGSDVTWSLLALAKVGVPSEVLDLLPALDEDDDAGWLRALERAIAAVVPPPATLGREATAVVNGAGAAGAATIMRAALTGIAPGTITVGDRPLPATAAELARVVRSCVVS